MTTNFNKRVNMTLQNFPLPWEIVCKFNGEDYIPSHIIANDGSWVMSCDWGAATTEGKLMYATVVETMNSVKDDYGL